MTSIDAAGARKPVRRAAAAGRLRAFAADESGATAIEYGLLVAGLALAILTAVATVGSNIGGTLNKVSNVLK